MTSPALTQSEQTAIDAWRREIRALHSDLVGYEAAMDSLIGAAFYAPGELQPRPAQNAERFLVQQREALAALRAQIVALRQQIPA